MSTENERMMIYNVFFLWNRIEHNSNRYAHASPELALICSLLMLLTSSIRKKVLNKETAARRNKIFPRFRRLLNVMNIYQLFWDSYNQKVQIVGIGNLVKSKNLLEWENLRWMDWGKRQMIEEKMMFSWPLWLGKRWWAEKRGTASGLWTKTNSNRSSSTVIHRLIDRYIGIYS